MTGICVLVLQKDHWTVGALLSWYELLVLRGHRGHENDHDGDGDAHIRFLLLLGAVLLGGMTHHIPVVVVVVVLLLLLLLPEETPASFSSFSTPPACSGLDSAPAA
jgi:hypothetical protein